MDTLNKSIEFFSSNNFSPRWRDLLGNMETLNERYYSGWVSKYHHLKIIVHTNFDLSYIYRYMYFFLFCQSSYLFFPYTEIRWIAWWNCYNLYFYTSTGADTGNVTISPNSFPYLDERNLRWLSPCIIWEPQNNIINIYINDLYIMSYHSKIKNLVSSILDKGYIFFILLTQTTYERWCQQLYKSALPF